MSESSASAWRKRPLRRSRCCVSQALNSGLWSCAPCPSTVSESCKSWLTPSASVSVALPRISSAPTPLRNWCSRWRSEFRAASASLSGHSNAASRVRGVGPSSASQASNAASREASGTVASPSRNSAGAWARVTRRGRGLLVMVITGTPGPAPHDGRSRRPRASGTRCGEHLHFARRARPHHVDHAGYTGHHHAVARQGEAVWRP